MTPANVIGVFTIQFTLRAVMEYFTTPANDPHQERLTVPADLRLTFPPLRLLGITNPFPEGEWSGGEQRLSRKEQNRVAAQKWREKKESYRSALEDANEQLRAQAFRFLSQIQELRTENTILEQQLDFFHNLMRAIISPGQ
jgi:hypothetical protein